MLEDCISTLLPLLLYFCLIILAICGTRPEIRSRTKNNRILESLTFARFIYLSPY